MNKSEITSAIAQRASLEPKDATAAVNAFIDVVTETVASGGKIALPGFGTFEPRARAERQARNPQTGEPITILAKTVPAFKAGSAFKTAVAG